MVVTVRPLLESVSAYDCRSRAKIAKATYDSVRSYRLFVLPCILLCFSFWRFSAFGILVKMIKIMKMAVKFKGGCVDQRCLRKTLSNQRKFPKLKQELSVAAYRQVKFDSATPGICHR